MCLLLACQSTCWHMQSRIQVKEGIPLGQPLNDLFASKAAGGQWARPGFEGPEKFWWMFGRLHNLSSGPPHSSIAMRLSATELHAAKAGDATGSPESWQGKGTTKSGAGMTACRE